jgi:hypothetical protein
MVIFLHYFNEISKVATMPSILGLQVKNISPNLDNTFINAHLLNSNKNVQLTKHAEKISQTSS